MTAPPQTPREEVVEDRHGTHIVDPYRWLERDDDEVQTWVDDQNTYARAVLDGISDREALAERFQDLVRLTEYRNVVPTDAGYYQRIREGEEEQPVLYFRESMDGDDAVVVDPNELSESGTTSVDWWAPSTDGSLVVYGVAEGGTENYDVVVEDVETGTELARIPETGRGGAVAWTEGGFYFNRTGSADDGAQMETALCYYDIDAETDQTVYDDFDPREMPGVVTADDGEHAVVVVDDGWERSDVYRLVDGELVDLVVGRDARYHATIEDHTLYLRTSEDAPRYRLLALDLDEADPTTREVVPERDVVLDGVTVFDDHVVVATLEDGVAGLERYDRDGGNRTELDLPGMGSVGGLDGNGDELFVRYQSYDTPPTILRYDLTDGTRSAVASPDVDVPDVEVERQHYAAEDGTEAPVFVVGRPDRDQPGPALLNAYGGFGISITPGFDPLRIPFLEAGGTFAQAILRGGGEFGERWHEAGMYERKPNTFEDVIAAAEHLLETGTTTSDHLAIAGGSNGGLTVGAAITRRPDLFAAAYCTVPLLDMVRFNTALLGEYWTREYGSPDDPEDFEYLYDYSPYHNVEETAYPAVLFKTAEGDTRVHPFHARKMAARLQEHQTADDPILLRTEPDTGHGVGKPTSQRVAEAADKWAFLYDQLGVDGD